MEWYFATGNTLIKKPGRAICRADLMDADLLLVRSITQVNEALLQGTAVKFVGSATVGADHLETKWLDQQGIQWALAAGCSTTAVAEYVLCTIAATQKTGCLPENTVRAAIVGAGRIGSEVAIKLKQLGFGVSLCDPFLTQTETVHFETLTGFDLISFHTPLSKTGPHPTFHLAEADFFQRRKKTVCC